MTSSSYTCVVQSGSDSSESEISEYSEDPFLSSDFTLSKNTKERKKIKYKTQHLLQVIFNNYDGSKEHKIHIWSF